MQVLPQYMTNELDGNKIYLVFLYERYRCRCFFLTDTNHPPVAQVVGPKTLFLPVNSIVLNGSNSTDDKGIVEYNWEQIK